MPEGPNGLPLFILRCDGCGGEWPADRFAWAKLGDVDAVTSNCLVLDCTGIVRWTGEEWTRERVV